MSSDALERLRKRQRPSVPSRDASLNAPSVDTSTSRNHDIQIPEQAQVPEPLKTKQSTLRLEASLSQRLSEVCQTQGISREVLIEALFQHYESDPEAWQAILTEAKSEENTGCDLLTRSGLNQ